MFESLSPEIATVDATGLVLGVAEGTAEIRVTAGSFSATVMVTVTLATVEYVKTGIRVTRTANRPFIPAAIMRFPPSPMSTSLKRR